MFNDVFFTQEQKLAILEWLQFQNNQFNTLQDAVDALEHNIRHSNDQNQSVST